MRNTPQGLLAAVLCLTSSVILPPAQAPAQQAAIVQMSNSNQPARITARDRARIADLLGLDESQRSALATLHDGYLAQLRAASDETREQMRALTAELQDGDMGSLRQKMPEIMRRNQERGAAIESSFLGDTRVLLTPAQAEKWPAVERLRRRSTGLRDQSLSMAGVDLIDVVSTLKLVPASGAAVKDTLEQYELALDRELVEQAAQRARREDVNGKELDMATFAAREKENRAASAKVAELNQTYSRRIASALAPEEADKFNSALRAKAFRQIYGPSSVSKPLAAAAKFTDLSAEQRAKLKELEENYRRAAAPLNDRWAGVLEKAETEGTAGGRGGRIVTRGGPANPELSDARKSRRELDERTTESLNQILTAEQRERLPAPTKSNEQTRVAGGPMPGGHGMVVVTTEETEDAEDAEDDMIIETRTVKPAPK